MCHDDKLTIILSGHDMHSNSRFKKDCCYEDFGSPEIKGRRYHTIDLRKYTSDCYSNINKVLDISNFM